jgi:tetratricopeptide (TPR) repeat protein
MAYDGVIGERQARRLLSAVCVFLVALASAGAVEAADTSGKLEAKAHFRAGQSHYNLNEFTDALVEFKEAYRLFPDPVFLYNLGQCERQLGHLDEAIRFYRSFLREQPKAPNREEVSRRIEEMEAALKNKPAEGAAPAVAPPAAPAPVTAPPVPALAATVAPVAPVAPAEPTPAALPGQSLPATPSVTAPAAASDRIDLSANAAPQAEAGSEPIYKRWWFWTAAAAVAVGAGVGIYAATAGGGGGAPSTELGTKRVF